MIMGWSCATISKAEHLFVRVRAVLAVIHKGRLGLHEPAFLNTEGKIRKNRFDCGLQCGDHVAILDSSRTVPT